LECEEFYEDIEMGNEDNKYVLEYQLKQPLTLVNEAQLIKSTTNCPTCGIECKIGGEGETHYFIPQPINIEEMAANLADPNICKTDNWIAGAKEMEQKLLPVVRELMGALETTHNVAKNAGNYYSFTQYSKAVTTLEKYKHLI